MYTQIHTHTNINDNFLYPSKKSILCHNSVSIDTQENKSLFFCEIMLLFVPADESVTEKKNLNTTNTQTKDKIMVLCPIKRFSQWAD